MTDPHGSADLLTLLNSFLLRAEDGPVVLLRPLPNDFDFRRDDVDLLLSEQQRTKLLLTIFNACAAGQLHLRVRQASPEKVQLCLWQQNGTSSLTVDLWSAFTQLPQNRRRMIPADCLLKIAATEGRYRELSRTSLDSPLSATIPMPADMDLCLLILHIASKKKPLTSPVVRQRLQLAIERLRKASLDQVDSAGFLSEVSLLLNSAESLLASVSISPRLLQDAERYLRKRIRATSDERCGPILQARENRRPVTRFRRWLINRVPCLTIVGSDGSGKSSVIRVLRESEHFQQEPVVAKKLYRRSLVYQLLSGLAKRIGGIERGEFDDRIAAWITFRASILLWCHFVFRALNNTNSRRAATLFMDRSVSSFLIVDRKSSYPRLHRFASWLESWTPPATTLLLVVPWRLLAERKQEMSFQGHENYQRLLFEQALRQQPVDMIVIANTQSPDVAAGMICRICSECHGSPLSVPTEEAAA